MKRSDIKVGALVRWKEYVEDILGPNGVIVKTGVYPKGHYNAGKAFATVYWFGGVSVDFEKDTLVSCAALLTPENMDDFPNETE